ncbi:MAG: metal-dependent hydrolase [Rhodoplanes sp.]
MFIGHYAVALGAKRVAPRANLGTLVAAALFLDLLWPALVLLGIERVNVDPGATVFTPLDFEHYPWSHSLLMALVWAAVFGGIYYAVRNYPRGAAVVALLVVSHWILDAPMHRPDLPLTPWSPIRVGAGLWNNVPLTLGIELVLFAFGAGLYAGATHARDTIGFWGFITFVFLLLAIYAANIVGPPPPDDMTVAWVGQAQWLFVLLAAWTDRHRQVHARICRRVRAA